MSVPKAEIVLSRNLLEHLRQHGMAIRETDGGAALYHRIEEVLAVFMREVLDSMDTDDYP